MNYRKTAILLTVVILLVGGGVIALVAYRSAALRDRPAPPGTVNGGEEMPPSGNGGGLQPPPQGNGQPQNGEAEGNGGTVQTAVSEEGEPYVCEVSDDLLDCDYDGLLNGEEREAGTDPLEGDSDGDGFSDWVEAEAHGTDPNDPNSKGSPHRRETSQNP